MAVACNTLLGGFEVESGSESELGAADAAADAPEEEREILVVLGTRRLSGVVRGLRGSGLVLTNGGSESAVAPPPRGGPDTGEAGAEVRFEFGPRYADGSEYAISVASQPRGPSQRCTVDGGAGRFRGDVDDIVVNCVTSHFSVSGQITLVKPQPIVIQNNGRDDLSQLTSGPFTFVTGVKSGERYEVTVRDAPIGNRCVVTNGSGVVGDGNVTDVAITCTMNNGTVVDVAGATSPIALVPCGDGTNASCTKAAAESSCVALGKKLVSHASDGSAGVTSLGATTSCAWSVSYFTNNEASLARPGRCLVAVSNADWSSCCNASEWHGNTLPLPLVVGQQFGFVESSDSGFNGSLTNVSGATWGCKPVTTTPATPEGCETFYVACR